MSARRAAACSGAAIAAFVAVALPPALAPAPACAQAIGAFSLTGGYAAHARGSGGGGGELAVAFTPVFGPLSFGPEVGVAGLGRQPVASECPVVDCPDRLGVAPEVAWHAGGVVRLEVGALALRPYAVAGAGLYSWRSSTSDVTTSLELVGYSAGLGVRSRLPWAAWSARLEARRHDNLSHSGSARELAFYTVSAGLSRVW